MLFVFILNVDEKLLFCNRIKLLNVTEFTFLQCNFSFYNVTFSKQNIEVHQIKSVL